MVKMPEGYKVKGLSRMTVWLGTAACTIRILEGKLKGSFMVLKKWEYLSPMFPRLHLEKQAFDRP
jgi:hypothetical protein